MKSKKSVVFYSVLVLLFFSVNAIRSQECMEQSAEEVFKSKVLPVLGTNNTLMSCIQCHYADFSKFKRRTSAQNLQAMENDGLVNADHPMASNLLTKIAKAKPLTSDPEVQAMIQKEYDAFLEWITLGAGCVPAYKAASVAEETFSENLAKQMKTQVYTSVDTVLAQGIKTYIFKWELSHKKFCYPCHTDTGSVTGDTSPVIFASGYSLTHALQTLTLFETNNEILLGNVSQSKLITKPISAANLSRPACGTGITHGGGLKFGPQCQNEPEYQDYLTWLNLYESLKGAGSNLPPVISAFNPNQSVVNATVGQTIVFSVTASDPDGDPLTYFWMINSDAGSSTTNAQSVTATTAMIGNNAVSVDVSDGISNINRGWSLIISTPGNTPPVINSFSPTNTYLTLDFDDTINFSVSASDPESDPLTFSWDWNGLSVGVNNNTYQLITSSSMEGLNFLEVTVTDGQVPVSQSWNVEVQDPVDLRQPVNGYFKNFILSQNNPNPFNPYTVIEFSIPADHSKEFVNLTVYNFKGEYLATLLREERGAGLYSVQWNGRDALGQSVPAGIYFYELKAGPFTQMKKMVKMN